VETPTEIPPQTPTPAPTPAPALSAPSPSDLSALHPRLTVLQAAADERRLVGELARHAERELVAAGRSVSGAVQEKLRATLHAVASDPEAREGLAAGRLVRDHEASGLGLVGESTAPSTGAGARRQRKEPPATAAAALERRTGQLEKRLERARARRNELDEKSADAGRRLRDARREAARVAADLERAEAAEERTRSRAEDAAEAVTALERELRGLTATHGR
jgi:chromosome segregation ATPase